VQAGCQPMQSQQFVSAIVQQPVQAVSAQQPMQSQTAQQPVQAVSAIVQSPKRSARKRKMDET